jgi:hypothetical protein
VSLSGVLSQSYTANEAVTRALKKCGVLGQGFTASADEMSDGLDTLSEMLSSWSTEGPNLWTKAEQNVTLVSGVATYTLSPRPRLVYNARWCDSVITNRALYARDWTQSAWTKSNMTTALSQTGVDGVASSATLLTASAGNATALQSVTRASDDWAFALFVKRVTGTGAISLTLDGGSTYTAITDDINADGWTQIGVEQEDVTNPSFGVKITTSGDAIAVDYAIASIDGISTSAFDPIATTTANVSIGVESLPLTPFDAQDWDNFLFKRNPGNPLKYFVDKQRTSSTITFWPVPSFSSGAQMVKVGYERAWEMATSGAQDLDIPAEAMETVVMCLAARFCEDYQLTDPNSERIRERAATLYEQFMGFDRWGDVDFRVTG